ncbi:MAG: CapA family protein, partial [Desulfovibrio sp.]|nr:CapA family protein [Desulfovibrio sp.]
DVESSEIKLGSSGCMLIMLARYAELINAKKYLPLMRCVARGILAMQEEDGSFVHVLNSKDFSLKERSRIVYYDGEAVFGLLRLYSLTKDKQLLEASQRAFDRFIATDHWKNHDHWLSYSVNELTRYAPQHRYFEFGIRNFNGYLNFVATRDTAYPTLLELMLAANEMLHRLEAMPEMADLCSIVNRDAFVHALHRRAYLLLNGYFWPEFAMFFANPAKIVGSFFIKHHAFRVRIDDVQHYISGFIGYAELLRSKPAGIQQPSITMSVDKGQQPIIFFGGDVTLGRRMHRADAKPLAHVTYMQQADVRIVNLECVIANDGSQGVIKGEGGPYYFHARPEQTHILVDAGIDVVATANNHSGDYGPQALLEQREYLDKAGIAHAGSGTCLDEAAKPAFVRAGALTLALFSVDTTQKHFAANQEKPGTLYLPITQPDRWKEVLGPRIAEARQCAHLVFVAVHWGANNASAPTEDERAIGRLLIDLDCDAVLGTSAHIVQGVEVYRGRPILHDAGDFLFDSREKVSRPGGCFLLETGRQGVTGVRFYPLDICYCHTQPATGNRAREMCEQFAKSCHALWTKAVVSAEEACVTIPLPKPPERAQPAHPWNGTYTSHAIPALESPHSTWIAAEVPEDAAIAPVQLGPLTLVGCRIPPNRLTMTQRQMLWVETWWMVQEPVHTSCSISLLGVPLRKCTMPPFGNGMEHEGCDWMWPTNRWKPGTIYREWFGLRPPNQPRMVSSDLQLEIRVTCGTQTFGPYIFPTTCALRLPNSPYYRGDVPESALHSLPRQCWNAQQLADVTGGTWSPPPPEGWFVSAVVRGSKQISMVPQPVLYVASTSKDLDYHEQFSKLSKFWDSHKNLPVLTKKTAGAIVSHVVANLPPEYPQLVVSDPIKAIIELGLTARRRFKGKVIAITGTVGKSSVASMLVHVLRKRHTVHTTYDNYNSRVGVPVVLASLPQDTDFAVIEIAQSALWMRRGPITLDICPDVSVITEVGLSQTTNASIRSVMDVARFKSRVFHGLTDNGIAVFSDHLEGFDHILSTARTHAARSIICGSGQHATSQITHIQDTANGHHVTASIEGIPIEFDVTPHGMPSIRNTMLVLGVLAAVGIAPQEGIEALKSYTPLYGRLEYSDCLWEGRNIRVIDDSWNAEVLSFKRALDAAPYMKREKQGRLIAVLGRIVHLGAKAK